MCIKDKYSNELDIIRKIGVTSQLVVTGFHAQDCVKRVALAAYECGISTLVDLDLTVFFFYLYKKDYYFSISNYDPNSYKEFITELAIRNNDIAFLNRILESYASPIYGFNGESDRKIK